MRRAELLGERSARLKKLRLRIVLICRILLRALADDVTDADLDEPGL